MSQLRFFLAAVCVAFAGNAFAVGTLIPATGRVDVIHDFARDVIYVTAGDSVLRYHVGTGAFLPAYVLGGNLKGMDLSPDGNTLAVADTTRSETQVWVHLVDLRDGSASRLVAPRAFMEGGTWAASYGSDGSLLVTSRFEGSGWVPLRRFDPSTGIATELMSVRQDTMLVSSGDQARIGFAESNISSGPFGRYTVANGLIEYRTGYDQGTSWFNFEIGANRDGSQLAIPTYGGTFFYDNTLTRVATVGQYAGPQPIGVAYHPVENLVYFPWAQTRQVKVFDTTTFAEVGSYDFESNFSTTGNWAFVDGRTRLSADGSLLMVTVAGGVRFHRLYAPLDAADVAASTLRDAPVAVGLAGSIGNGGALSYALLQPPTNGSVSISGATATYTPNPGFVGSDSFTYAAGYGRAAAEGRVTVTVQMPNQAPVAADQAVDTNEDTAVAFSLQATDPEGSPLAYTIVTQPLNGTLSGTAPALVYTPGANFNGTDSFSFSASDGLLESNVATVTLRVASVNDAPVAAADSGTVKRRESVTIAVLANDSDVDGDTLSITGVTQPASGSATIVGNGIRYTAAPNFVGTMQFSYVVSDGKGGSASAIVSITVTK